MLDNALPQNVQAERAVLGSCLLSASALETVVESLKPEHFYDPTNKAVYEVCLSMYLAGKPIDLSSLQIELTRKGLFERVGGQPYLAELSTAVYTTATAGYHAEIVRGMALRRQLIDAGQKIAALGYDNNVEDSEIVSDAEKILLDASAEREPSGSGSLKNSIPSVVTKIEELKSGIRKNTGFLSNFTDLDKILAGFQPGTLNIIAARPSMGKTALALNIAQFGGDIGANDHVLFFSLEMSREQLIHRMLAAQTLEIGTGVKVSAMISGEMSDYDFYAIQRASERLQERNICIYDTPELTSLNFRAKCRRFKMRHPDLALIVVDYLQLMSSGRKNSENRQYEVAEISRVLKSVAVELECPVIALSQLSRATEQRTEKKPQLSDLRDSGAIEQDADTVILLYREDYYSDSENNPLRDSRANLRIAKNRNGTTGLCSLTFKREFTRFVNHGNLE